MSAPHTLPAAATRLRQLAAARERRRAGGRCRHLRRRHRRGARHAARGPRSCRPSRMAACWESMPRAALALPGVRGVVLAQDIPGDPSSPPFAHDEPIFAIGHGGARRPGHRPGGGRHRDAGAQGRATVALRHRGPAGRAGRARGAGRAELRAAAGARAARRRAGGRWRAPRTGCSGQFEVGGQEHFYLEGQIAYVLPQEQNQWLVYSSTQHPGEVQHWVAHALGLDNHARARGVPAHGRRLRRQGNPVRPPGGVGGRCGEQAQVPGQAAAGPRRRLHDHRQAPPVCLRLHRGLRRHRPDHRPASSPCWPTAASAPTCPGRWPTARSSTPTTPISCSDVDITSYRCKTNTQSHTAFRGFGGPQGVIVIETLLGDIARHLGLDALDVRRRNLYGITRATT